MRKFILMAITAIFPLGLFAARLTLRDGTVLYGDFISGTSQNIMFRDESGVRRRFDLNQVQSLDFNAVNTSANRYNNNSYNEGNRNNDRYDANRSADRMVNEYNRGGLVTLPVGTELSVRTDETINSQTATEGRTYPATVQRDIVDPSGNIVIPRGSQAELVIRQVNPGGTLSSGNLVLDLQSVRLNGHRYMVNTADLAANGNNGIGANRRTGEMVGGGAVLGTLLGAIAGGGKGAAIGALAGAAAGGGAEVLTKGHDIRVPAETVLTFRLDQPLRLYEAR